jgi:hypothetical protein
LVGGGGLHVFRGTVRVINSTLTGNRSPKGGGVFVDAFFDYGYSYECVAGSLVLENNIVSGNVAGVGREIYVEEATLRCAGSVASIRNLLGHDGDAGVVNVSPAADDLIPAEPLAAILQPSLEWNGGPTPTHALPPGSPAVDIAPSNACAATPVGGLDQRGWARNADGDGQASDEECDLGAFERQPWPHEAFLPVASGGGPGSGQE